MQYNNQLVHNRHLANFLASILSFALLSFSSCKKSETIADQKIVESDTVTKEDASKSSGGNGKLDRVNKVTNHPPQTTDDETSKPKA